ncbi:MAG: 2OG-Fe(II) oxygenase [Pseudomonadales bacterium]|nr:2OG-Fe(II) oxygenase [Pseudomonadales bacterium]
MNDSPASEQAIRLDESGAHYEAINVLARATRNGDLTAMTRLGKRLLVGDRAPYLPKDAAGMILEAAQKGNAEAVALVAVFQCTGVFQQKNWQHAIVTLTHAAKLGWQPAREQLLLLSATHDHERDAGLLDNNDQQFWQRLGETLDLSSWFVAGSSRTLCTAPLVRSFPDFIPAEVCRLLIRQSRVRLKPALVYDPLNKRDFRSSTRTNSIAQFNLVENDIVHFLLQEHMSAASKVPMVQMEATAILHYSPGQEISEHFDFVDPNIPNYRQEIAENGQRIITFLIYLNDDYTGGETVFPKLDISHKGQAGEGMYFVNALADGSSDLRTLHAGTPPLQGEKWIVSQFIRNRQVKYIS